MVSQISPIGKPLPLLLLFCRLTIKPSMPKSFNDGGHGHAEAIELMRKRASMIRLKRRLWIMMAYRRVDGTAIAVNLPDPPYRFRYDVTLPLKIDS